MIRAIRHLTDPQERERGSFTIFTAVLAATMLLMVGLVYDGATKIRAARDATSVAAESARAGAQELTGVAIQGNPSPIDISRGASAAQSYLSQVGASGTVSINGTDVTVTVTEAWSPQFTGLFGQDRSVTGTATVSSLRSMGGEQQ